MDPDEFSVKLANVFTALLPKAVGAARSAIPNTAREAAKQFGRQATGRAARGFASAANAAGPAAATAATAAAPAANAAATAAPGAASGFKDMLHKVWGAKGKVAIPAVSLAGGLALGGKMGVETANNEWSSQIANGVAEMKSKANSLGALDRIKAGLGMMFDPASTLQSGAEALAKSHASNMPWYAPVEDPMTNILHKIQALRNSR